MLCSLCNGTGESNVHESMGACVVCGGSGEMIYDEDLLDDYEDDNYDDSLDDDADVIVI